MDDFIRINGANIHNLKDIDVSVPKNKLTVIVGLAGSGRKSLAFDVLHEEGMRSYLALTGQALPKDSTSARRLADGVPSEQLNVTVSRPCHSITGLTPTIAVGEGYLCSFPSDTVGEAVQVTRLLVQLFAEYGSKKTVPTVGDKTLAELTSMCIDDLLFFFRHLTLLTPLTKEIIHKLSVMIDVVLPHLSLSRAVSSLSDNERWRLSFAFALITDLDSVTYVLYQPMSDLHESEKQSFLRVIRRLVSKGHTVVAIENDISFLRSADYVIELGPYGGIYGGEVISEGTLHTLIQCKQSKFAPYLSLQDSYFVKQMYRQTRNVEKLHLANISLHNLKSLSVDIPLNAMVGVAGVTGSGKRSLIFDSLVPLLGAQMGSDCVIAPCETQTEATAKGLTMNDGRSAIKGKKVATLTGSASLKRCYVLDRKPIKQGKNTCPATYTDVFKRLRTFFAGLPTAKEYGCSASTFSVQRIGCNADSLKVLLDGKNIYDILDLSVSEALSIFEDKDESLFHILMTMSHVDLEYLKLGQAISTLTGEECERLKLAHVLASGKHASGCLYILDDPMAGLSIPESEHLLQVLDDLVERDNSVLLVANDPYVLSNCDYILELGPNGGSAGGQLIAEGTPAQLCKNTTSVIGRYLK